MNDQSERWSEVGRWTRDAVARTGKPMYVLAARADVSDKYLSKLMNGTPGDYRAASITRIGRVLGVQHDWLHRLLAGLQPEPLETPREDLAAIRADLDQALLDRQRLRETIVLVDAEIRSMADILGQVGDTFASILDEEEGDLTFPRDAASNLAEALRSIREASRKVPREAREP